MVDPVLHREHVPIVGDEAQVSWATILLVRHAVDEHLSSTEIIGRRVQPDDEMSWEKILLVNFVVTVWINENVGERSSRITHVTAPPEQREKLTDLSVDARNLALTEFDIDRGIVSLIVDQQHRLVDHVGTMSCAVLLEPVHEVRQSTRILLDHQHHRHRV